MPKLTKSVVQVACNHTPNRERMIWDTDLPRFGLRLRIEGQPTYIVKYRNPHGRQRKLTLGDPRVLMPEEARELARQALAKVAGGFDPVQDRTALREAPTVNDLCNRYLTDHAEVRKKPRCVREDRKMVERHIRPHLGQHKVTEVTRTSVARLHGNLRHTPTQANRVLALLSKMFNLAIMWGLRPDENNPCRLIPKYKEHKRERYLSPDELMRLGSHLISAEVTGTESPTIIGAIRLLLFTGCRLSEVLTLKWEHVDHEARCLRLPDSKTGAKVVHLNPQALAVLASLVRIEGNPYVLPGKKPGAHLVNLEKAWGRIRERSGLHNVRIHDLRHTFASIGAMSGLGLPILGKALGHTQVSTTHRYAHLASEPVKNAVDCIGLKLADSLRPKPVAVA